MNYFKTLFSGYNRRFIDRKYNLDLSYITPRIIVMSCPASFPQSLLNNNINDVSDFLYERHGNNYLIINLDDIKYDKTKFSGNTEDYKIDCEKPPDLLSLFIICDKINDYLSQDISNVIVINSKGGEGRAGVVVCCYLLYIKKFQEPIDAFNYYSNKRLYQGEGVSQPCQKRYVNYFYNLLSKKLMNFPYRIKIVSIIIKNMYEIYHQGYYLVEIHDFRSKEYREIDVSPNNYEIDSENKTLVLKMENLLEYDQYGDIIIKICYNEMFFVKKLGKISFNTAFLPKNEDEIIFHSNEIDPDTILNSNYKFSEDYEIQINFKKLCNSCPFKKPNYFCQECTKFFKTNKIAYDKFKDIKDNQQIYLEKNILYKKLILFGNIDSDDSDIILQKEEENIANKIKTPRNELKINQVNKNEKNFFDDDIENNSFDSDKEEYQDKTIKTDNKNKKTDKLNDSFESECFIF